jgi:hypothetical protein
MRALQVSDDAFAVGPRGQTGEVGITADAGGPAPFREFEREPDIVQCGQ